MVDGSGVRLNGGGTGGHVVARARITAGAGGKRARSSVLILVLSIVVGLILLAAWVLTHLPRAEVSAPGSGAPAGLAISNRGLPLSDVRVIARMTDGSREVVHTGLLGRGETTVLLPATVNSASVSGVEIEGTVLGLMTVHSYSVQSVRLAETGPGAGSEGAAEAGTP